MILAPHPAICKPAHGTHPATPTAGFLFGACTQGGYTRPLYSSKTRRNVSGADTRNCYAGCHTGKTAFDGSVIGWDSHTHHEEAQP